MAIAATMPSLQSQIANAMQKGPAAEPPVVAADIIGAVAQSASAGLQPLPGPAPPIPVIPAGQVAATAIYTGVLLANPPDSSISAAGLAGAVALVAPQVPPFGLMTLRTQLEVSLNKGPAAEVQIIAQEWASAIIAYYNAGGVI